MKHYRQRDIESQGDHFIRHLDAMTAERLHAKSDIAAELAHRDLLIAALVKGMKWWADQEDGIPVDCWTAYADAIELLTGNRPEAVEI